MRRSALPLLGSAAALVLAVACADAPSSPATAEPSLGKTTETARYKLQFIIDRPGLEGEITSAEFPANGVALNTADPWKSLKVSGALVTLTSPTHGDWASLKCSQFGDRKVEWVIANTPEERTFAGDWILNVSTQRDRKGNISLYMDGPRAEGAEGGGIHNVATTGPAEESNVGDAEFRLTFTNARMGFGSNSYPDDLGTLSNLPGYEAACANFTLVARKVTTP